MTLGVGTAVVATAGVGFSADEAEGLGRLRTLDTG